MVLADLTICTRIGVISPSSANSPFANAAADVCGHNPTKKYLALTSSTFIGRRNDVSHVWSFIGNPELDPKEGAGDATASVGGGSTECIKSCIPIKSC